MFENWPSALILALRITFLAISLIASILVVIFVMKQSSDSDGLGAISGSKETSSFYGKNKAKRTEERLKKWTIICSIVIAVCCVGFFLMAL